MQENMPKINNGQGQSSLTLAVARIVDHPVFANTIIGLILINAVIVGLETYPSLYNPYKGWFYVSERILLWAFTVEIILRIIATRPWPHFFKNGWNLFDFFIVASSLIFVNAYFVSVLRILRVLRVLRTVTVIPSLQRLVGALFRTIPAIGNIILLMSLLFYIFAVIGTILFKNVEPEYFGSLHLTLLTLFQIVTLESWASGVMRPLMLQVTWSWVYFVSFILFGTFIIFNLFVGVIVNNVAQEDEAGEEGNSSAAETLKNRDQANEIADLRSEIAELKQLIVALHGKDSASKNQ